MTIVAQNRSVVVNYDNLVAVELRGNYIHAYPASGGNPIPIGVYDDDRAKEVYADLVSKAYPPDCFVMESPDNFTAMKQYRYGVIVNEAELTRYSPHTYYMPEE